MCGGKGERLKAGEKPMLKVCGKRLIDHSLSELKDFEILAVTSPFTPNTEKYLESIGVKFYRAKGRGFIEDYIEACKILRICEPILIVSADLVYFRKGILKEVVNFYKISGKPALKVVSANRPIGINVVDASMIDYEQDESIFIISEEDVVNINTIEDAKRAEEIWKLREKDLQKDLKKS